MEKFTLNLIETLKDVFRKLGKVKTVILILIWCFIPSKVGMPLLFLCIIYIFVKSIKQSKK